MKSLSALVLILLLSTPGYSAVATFSGLLTNRLGPANILDPLPRQIQAQLSFADGTTLTSVSGNVTIFGVGTFVARPDFGAAITRVGGNLTFNLVHDLSGTATLFQFSGFPGSAIDQATIDSINFATTGVNFNIGGTLYSGSISHAPEPSTGVLLAVCTFGCAFWQVRARNKLKSKST